MEIFKTSVRFDQRLYIKCKKGIDKHRRLMLFEHLINSVEADNIFPDRLDEHDNYFEPTNEYEKRFWDSCREIAKKDMQELIKKVQGGIKSAEVRKQKKLTPEEKQETLQKAIRSVGAVGKNEVIITPNFELPHDEYFDSYRKTYSADELKKVVDWLKKTKLNEKVDYMWIGKQIQNFKKRNTGKIF